MLRHKKPSTQELNEAIKKADEAIDAMDAQPEVTPVETPPAEPEAPSVEPEVEPVKEPEKPIEVPKEPELTQEEIDYKKKFIASTREAQILSAKNKKMAEAFEKAESIAEPTEEELTKEYSDWEILGEFEKKMARQAMLSSRRFAAIAEISKGFKDLEAWQIKVDSFIEDPKNLADYPELEGKQDEFKYFATKPTRRGVDFETLVSAFSHDYEKSKPVIKKTQMFESGTGGPNDRPQLKDDKLSVEESRQLRKVDYKKWKELLLAGKIAIE